jgi:hypothetical protein
MLARFVGVSWEYQGIFTELNNLWHLKPRASKNIGISGDTTSFYGSDVT